jgi:K+-sensing histidine kinase KdpD
MQQNDFIPPVKERNPITQEAHRRQTFWQIYFPLLLFGALVVIAIIAAVLLENEGASKWADISLIYMVSLTMVIFLITTVAIVLLAIYMARLIKETPYFFFVIQRYTYLVEQRIKTATNSVEEPFLRINSFIAGARALRRK